MKRYLAGTVLAMSILAPQGHVLADSSRDEVPATRPSKGPKTIRIAMNDVTLADGARMVALLLKTRVEVTPSLKAEKISIRLNGVDGPTAIRELARVGGGVAARVDGGYLIATPEELEDLGLPDEAILSDGEEAP